MEKSESEQSDGQWNGIRIERDTAPNIAVPPLNQPVDDTIENDSSVNEAESEESDLDLDDDDLVDLNQQLPPELIQSRPELAPQRAFSKNDAESFVGGNKLNSKRVFSFQLPFGSNFNFSTNFKFRIPYISALFNSSETDDPIQEDIRLKLERQESINTLKEADYFKRFKGRDDVRFRAVKHSLSNKYNDLLPINLGGNPTQKEPVPEYESIYSRLQGNIVIMGGYRGSVLRDTKTGKRIWIPIKAGFHLKKINLLLGPNKEDEINAVNYIYPDGILKNIGPIDLCKTFIKKLNNGKTNVQEFGYDWRLSGDLVSDQLVEFLTKIYNLTGQPTLVIAHSMGGLIAHSALQKNPELFRSIIYVGVPSECLNILGPIRFGDSVLFSDKILTPEANFMMRSSFNFLPLTGKVFYNKETHEPFVLDLFDPATWVEYNLNPLVAKDRILKKSGLFDSSLNTLSTKLRSIRVRSPLRLSPRSDSFDENILCPSKSTDTGKSVEPAGKSVDSTRKSFDTGKTVESTGRGSETISAVSESTATHSETTATTMTHSETTKPESNLAHVSPTIPHRSISLKVSNTKQESVSPNYEEKFSVSFEQAYSYLSETLKSTKKFILSLDYRPELEPKYPPMAIVYGNTVPSVRGSDVEDIQDIKDGNYYNFFYGHGDGVVHQKWLMPERKGFKTYNEETGMGQIVGKFSTPMGHVNLMTDLKVMGEALNAVCKAEIIWGMTELGS